MTHRQSKISCLNITKCFSKIISHRFPSPFPQELLILNSCDGRTVMLDINKHEIYSYPEMIPSWPTTYVGGSIPISVIDAESLKDTLQHRLNSLLHSISLTVPYCADVVFSYNFHGVIINDPVEKTIINSQGQETRILEFKVVELDGDMYTVWNISGLLSDNLFIKPMKFAAISIATGAKNMEFALNPYLTTAQKKRYNKTDHKNNHTYRVKASSEHASDMVVLITETTDKTIEPKKQSINWSNAFFGLINEVIVASDCAEPEEIEKYKTTISNMFSGLIYLKEYIHERIPFVISDNIMLSINKYTHSNPGSHSKGYYFRLQQLLINNNAQLSEPIYLENSSLDDDGVLNGVYGIVQEHTSISHKELGLIGTGTVYRIIIDLISPLPIELSLGDIIVVHDNILYKTTINV